MLRRLALVATLALGCGGGDDDDDGNPTGPGAGGATNGTFTVVVNGTTWSATGTITVARQQNNFISVAGYGFAGSTGYAVAVGITNATGPGAHNLTDFGGGGDGSSVVVGGTQTGWVTALQGGSGTVTITTITANRIVGTFSGTAVVSSGTGGNLVLTSGHFDVTF